MSDRFPTGGIMEDVAEQATLRAIAAMRSNLGEQLTVDDLARAAMFSKFHFTRIFQRVTGVSPGRFLSALRLERAKELLVSTEMKVADVSITVGYNSVGTFSSRFSRSVGMSPTTFRKHAGFATAIDTEPAGRPGRPAGGHLTCNIGMEEPDDEALIFVGLFRDRIPEGRPVRCTVLTEPGRIRFDGVPFGTWHLLAQAAAPPRTTPFGGEEWPRPVSVATSAPISVRDDWIIASDLTLRPSRDLDPPVLLALLDVRKEAMQRMNSARHAVERAG
jgi:AraC family transcriptional regulator